VIEVAADDHDVDVEHGACEPEVQGGDNRKGAGRQQQQGLDAEHEGAQQVALAAAHGAQERAAHRVADVRRHVQHAAPRPDGVAMPDVAVLDVGAPQAVGEAADRALHVAVAQRVAVRARVGREARAQQGGVLAHPLQQQEVSVGGFDLSN